MNRKEGGRALAEAYDRMAADYRELWAPTLLPYGRSLLDRLRLAPARRVLDLGAGVGALVPEFGDRTDARLIVADRSLGMLRLNEAPLRVVLDAAWLPFADESFDAVVMAFMLFHVAEPDRALREVRRIVRSGGVAGAATWGSGASYPALDLWNEALAEVAAPLEEDVPDSTEATNTPEAMAGLFEEAGFASVQTEEAPFEFVQTVDSFIENRLRIGRSRRLVERLDPDARDRLVTQMRERLATLAPADLVDHDTVVFAQGVAPDR